MCYDKYAPLYEARGFMPLPIAPDDKYPACLRADGTYGKMMGWTTCTKPPRNQRGANIGIRLGDGLVAVDVDTDDPAIHAALPAQVRDSLVKKRGQRGWTSFLYGRNVPSHKYRIDGKVVLELLWTGRQTVIPPSIHPVTKRPYEWVGDGFELLDVDPERDLPHVPPDFEKQLEAVLKPFGYNPEAAQPEPVISPPKNDEEKSPHAQLNEFARANLAKWIPAMGLARYRRKRGPHLAYEAVATWRPSTQGRETNQRNYNLSITSRSGIKDFGDGRSYTPVDLVMAARTLNLSDAFAWLDDQLGWSSGGPEIVIPGPWEGSTENARPEEEPAEASLEAQRAKDDAILKAAGVWMHGDSLPPAPECSFDRLLPRSGAGTIVGQTGTRKTYMGVDLMVAGSAGSGDTRFAGRERRRRGGAVIIEFEYSDIPVRIGAAAKHRGVTDKRLPIMTFTKAPQMLLRKKINPASVKWYRDVLGAAHRYFMREFGLPLAYVDVDPLIDAAGFESENDSTEGKEVMMAFQTLGHEMDFLVVVPDHAGKDLDKGARGTSAKKGKADFELLMDEKVEDYTTPRTLVVKKLRNLPDGWGVQYWFEDVDVEVEGGKCEGNQAVVWGEETRNGEKKSGKPPKKQMAALKTLGGLAAKEGGFGEGEVWVLLDDWFDALISEHVIDPEMDRRNQRNTFNRIRDGLRDKGQIKVEGDCACLLL